MRRARTTISYRGEAGEDAQQKNLIEWCQHYKVPVPELGKLSEWIFHIPNGGKRNKVVAAKLKAIGTKAGVSDLFIPIPFNGYAGLWIEMKDVHVPGKRKPETQKSQREWLEKMLRVGYHGQVAYGWLQARNIILDYFGDTRYAR